MPEFSELKIIVVDLVCLQYSITLINRRNSCLLDFDGYTIQQLTRHAVATTTGGGRLSLAATCQRVD